MHSPRHQEETGATRSRSPSLITRSDTTLMNEDIELFPLVPTPDAGGSSSGDSQHARSPGARGTIPRTRTVSPVNPGRTTPTATGGTRVPYDAARNSTETFVNVTECDEHHDNAVLTSSHGGPSSFAGSRLSKRSWTAALMKTIVLDTWICEISAVVFSSACIFAIAVIITAYDKQPILRFPSGLTLNTIVSILSTSARSAIILTVSTSIGQLKWCWYSNSKPAKPLHDLQVMDDASRGLVGAASMLASQTGGYLAMLGGVVTLLMIGFSPFLQQLLDYPTRHPYELTDRAQILHNLNFTVDPDSAVDGLALHSAATKGLYADAQAFDRTPTCPTGRCEWENYKSVDWCSKCEDVTVHATLEDCDDEGGRNANPPNDLDGAFQYCNMTLGQGQSVSMKWKNESAALNTPIYKNTTEVIWTVSRYQRYDTDRQKALETYSGVHAPLLVLGHAAWDHTSNKVQAAEQCIISLCENEYSVRMNDGKISSEVLSTNFGHIFQWPTESSGLANINPMLGWRPNVSYVSMNASEGGYTYVNQAERAFWPVDQLSPFIAQLFEGRVTMETTLWENGVINSTDAGSSRPDIIGARSDRNLSARLESVAASLTNYGNGKTHNIVPGYAFSEEIYVHVRWGWMALPVLLQVLSILLFILTMIHSKRAGAPVWKSSLLAIWYHGHGHGHRECKQTDSSASSPERLSDMSRLADTTAVHLARSDDELGITFKRLPGGAIRRKDRNGDRLDYANE